MILSCGEALIDFVPRLLPEGEATYRPCPGGSPLNTAVAMARLGAPVGFYTQLSEDFFGQMLIDHLTASQVDVSLIPRVDRPTTLAFVNTDQEDVRYAFYSRHTADFSLSTEQLPVLSDDVTALQFGSVSLTGEPVATALENLMFRESETRLIALDPNIRPSLITDHQAYTQRFERWVTHCGLVKASVEDLNWLYPGRPLEQVVRDWQSLGTELILITDGSRASHAFGAAGHASIPVEPTEVVDAVGAGDTFHAGVLTWLHERDRLSRAGLRSLTVEEMTECLQFGNRVARLVCQREGANPPWKHELA